MKTLLFCTSHLKEREEYLKRYEKWAGYYLDLDWEDKTLFMIDDCSDASLVNTNLFNIIKSSELPEESALSTNKVNFVHFEEKAPCHKDGQAANSAGWWRGYLSIVDIAKKYDFERIIHVESDLYLISKNIRDFIEGRMTDGWHSFLCRKYNWPESSLQVINKDKYEAFEELRSDLEELGLENIDASRGPAELLLPFTRITKGFNGSRYGEDSPSQTAGMDYFAQCRDNTLIIAEK
jgi:hypothetical protein